MQHIAHCRVSKVLRKYTKPIHNRPNCFTNDTYYVAPKSTMNTLNYDMKIKQRVHLPMNLRDQEGI